MKTIKILMPFLVSLFLITACNSSTEGESVGIDDSSSANPTTDAMDYHPDQRQQIPTPDSSNTIGTDTINGSVSTPNTGTMKSYNNKKDSSQ